MTDARALLDAYAATYPGIASTLAAPIAGDRREAAAPRAFAALRAVLDEHMPVNFGGAHGKFCKTCSSGPADSPCPAPWPCPTVRAIATALEPK